MQKILSDNFIVEDLCYQKENINLWYSTLEKIAKGDDDLKSNYQNLHPEMFASLVVVIKDERILCFSGLQINSDRWGENIGRINSRMWIDPDYRFSGMVKFSGGNRFLNSYYCLPLQLREAERRNLKCLFISRENNPQGLAEYFKLIKINCNVDFELLPDRYNVCGHLDPIPESCKQFVGIYGDKSIWDLNMSRHTLA